MRIFRQGLSISVLLLVLFGQAGGLSGTMAGDTSLTEIKTAYSRYLTQEEIRPILSTLSGKEANQQRFRTLVRSSEEAYQGRYFILQAERNLSPASARLEWIATDSKEVRERSFSIPSNPNGWLYFGITGDDWPGPEVAVLAWRIELRDAQGNPVALWKSFLWEMP